MTKNFEKTDKQREAVKIMSKHTEVLLDGGSRSGKTFISVYAIIARAVKHDESRHLIVRRHFSHVKSSVWYQTIPDVLKKAFPHLEAKENKSDWFIEFKNGSSIWIAGTDDKERLEKLLGLEWDTIYMNEASQNTFETYEILKTRLNPQRDIKPLFLIDYNPPSMNHWGYKIFYQSINPANNQPIEDKSRYGLLKMNPFDNIDNLSDSYIKTLQTMSENKQRRFLHGEYGDDSIYALWKREWIETNRVLRPPKDCHRVVVAVDPAVTGKETSDDTGIIVIAEAEINDEPHFYVLEDRTHHGDVTGWGQEVVAMYRKYMADVVVAEVNQGGDLVEMNIKNYDNNINYESVRATRGKAVRAEPVADLYRRGYVHHVGQFQDLEDQMCTWTIEEKESPNNMDALVWGISFLMGDGSQYLDVIWW